MTDLTEQIRDVGRLFEALAAAVETEEGRAARTPSAERFAQFRRAAVARAITDASFRRRLFADPERVIGRPDEPLERLAHRLRALDEALASIEDNQDFDERGMA